MLSGIETTSEVCATAGTTCSARREESVGAQGLPAGRTQLVARRLVQVSGIETLPGPLPRPFPGPLLGFPGQWGKRPLQGFPGLWERGLYRVFSRVFTRAFTMAFTRIFTRAFTSLWCLRRLIRTFVLALVHISLFLLMYVITGYLQYLLFLAFVLSHLCSYPSLFLAVFVLSHLCYCFSLISVPV